MTGQCDRSRVRSLVKAKDFIECLSNLWRVLEPRSLNANRQPYKEAVGANLCNLKLKAILRRSLDLALCPVETGDRKF